MKKIILLILLMPFVGNAQISVTNYIADTLARDIDYRPRWYGEGQYDAVNYPFTHNESHVIAKDSLRRLELHTNDGSDYFRYYMGDDSLLHFAIVGDTNKAIEYLVAYLKDVSTKQRTANELLESLNLKNICCGSTTPAWFKKQWGMDLKEYKKAYNK